MSSRFGYINSVPDLATRLNTASTQVNEDVIYNFPTGFHLASTIATATAVTLTPRQVLGGLILQDPSGGAVTTTLPTAAALVAYFKGIAVGSTVSFYIRNTADAAETITVAVGTGITSQTGNTLTIAQNNTGWYILYFTNVTPGSEAALLVTMNSAMVH